MRKELVFILLVLFLCAGCNDSKEKMNGEYDLDAANITLDDRTISFYYNWYGSPSVDGEMKHWIHPIASTPGHLGDVGTISGLNDDIACNLYPELGTYSSNDPEIIRKHIRMHIEANVGVLSVTWQGESDYGNQSVSLLLDEAAKIGAKVYFHTEPFNGRNPQTVREDIQYIVDTYGDHLAFYRTHDKPPLFIHGSYPIKPIRWAELLITERGISVRNAKYDDLSIGLTLRGSELPDIKTAYMDGFYTYLAATGSTNTSISANWKSMQQWAEAYNKLFIPSAGPGYIDARIRPWNGGTTRDCENGKYYDDIHKAAIESGASYISITSFNEWHEGAQIEPAVSKKCAVFGYLDYKPLADGYHLIRTAYWVDEFQGAESTSEDVQRYVISRRFCPFVIKVFYICDT